MVSNICFLDAFKLLYYAKNQKTKKIINNEEKEENKAHYKLYVCVTLNYRSLRGI